jgi:hypothetical protein
MLLYVIILVGSLLNEWGEARSPFAPSEKSKSEIMNYMCYQDIRYHTC